MQVAMMGLGRMGANMAVRLMRNGHTVIGYSRTDATVEKAREQGIEAYTSIERAIDPLEQPRLIWLMVPAGKPVDDTIDAACPMLCAGDIVVDGGNSYYRDTMERAPRMAAVGLHLVDVGVSGGVWGLQEGYSMMVGGDAAAVGHIRPLLETLAPGPDRGWAHVGPSGAGHFVKMVHNGIEYGMMQAYAEGFALLRRKTELGLDLHQIARLWQHGSVIRSWLLDLIEAALAGDQDLADIAPYVADSGEGRWAVREAVDLDQAAPVITLSLLERLRSRDEEAFADRLLAVMRNQFGGHEMKHEEHGDGQ